MDESAFGREVKAQLKRRARIVTDSQSEISALLKRALEQTLGVLADQPSDYQLWQLPQLVKEIGRVAGELGDAAVAAVASSATAAWSAGIGLIDKPLAAAGAGIVALAPHINTRQLIAMRSFLTDRMSDVSRKAASLINQELGLVVIGAQSPFEAQTRIGSILKDATTNRAMTIVRTELQRVYSTASYESMAEAAAQGYALDKVWRRSSKAHPRPSHALADGQRRRWDEPFMIGGHALMYPHDPKAPAAEIINCGCMMIPKLPIDNTYSYKPTMPDKKPFTAEELARNPKLKMMVADG